MSVRGFFNSLRGSIRSTSSASSTSSRPSIASVNASFRQQGAAQTGTTSITLRGTPEFEQVSAGAKKEMLIMGSLQAPLFEPNPEDKRAPIDVCCVIDRSGSMAGEKLELVKKALHFVLDNLDSGDALSIVTYDTTVATPLQFIKMDKSGKKAATQAIEAIHPGDCTNLAGGLLEGLKVSKARKGASDICSVLLFTDGLANEGITNSVQITAEMGKLLVPGFKCSVFTFGFGADHDQNMLRSIAEAGSGMYYFVSDPDKIPLSFADCLGGLQSVVGQNLSLTVQCLGKGRIVKSLNTKYKVTDGADGNARMTLSLGDIYSEEHRDLIFLVEVPALSEPSEAPVDTVTLTLSYFNVLTCQDGAAEVVIQLARPASAPTDQKPNETLDIQRNRLRTAEAMEQSRKKADQGDISGAQKILKDTMTGIQGSVSAKEKFSEGLVKELDQCLDDMRDRDTYQREGAKKISRKEQAHYMQRSNKLEELEESFYETSTKAAFKSKAKKSIF